ncbi:uncharacterized protein LOC132717149 [Ruditapes philippinarum]|jgi:hypothetical protein|uniref:uncharacterized protein LOC132717149 n=1 Tax=Ruditapes philippinarum TaxID=129788 RepID=UPI00295B37C6|nr:uncharacterized protein LOC132717149 [Ruditapes philippinarum]
MSQSEDDVSVNRNLSVQNEDVLHLSDESPEFSGFSEDDVPVKNKSRGKGPGRIKSSVSKVGQEVAKTGKKSTNVDKSKTTKTSVSDKKGTKSRNANKSLIDLNKLSSDDLELLRSKLGLPAPQVSNTFSMEQSDMENEYVDLARAPNMQIEVENDFLDSDDSIGHRPARHARSRDMTKRLIDSMFGEDDVSHVSDDEDWGLPKIKQRNKGEAISSSLAKLINTACTALCDSDELCDKYPVPANCEKLNPPMVNMEIWKVMDKRSRSHDRLFQDIQSLLAAGMVPIIKLAKILKTSISAKPQAKQLLSDSLSILGQAQYNISIRRRYLIRPSLNKRYKNLCNMSVPISTSLFGDDISKEIKHCEVGVNLGKDYNAQYNRNSFRGRFSRARHFNRGRMTPYPQVRGGYSQRAPMRKGTFKSATVTAPPNGEK